MTTMRTDPLIAEIRAVRDQYAARFDYDVAAIFRDLRARQDASQRDHVHRPARAAAAGSGLGNAASPGYRTDRETGGPRPGPEPDNIPNFDPGFAPPLLARHDRSGS